MRSLSLLALLLFALIVPPSAASFRPRPRPARPTLMEELVAKGAPRAFKSFNGLYLTDDLPNLWAVRRQDWGRLQGWTIEQINDHEVAIKSTRGYYIGHTKYGDYAQQAEVVKEGEIFTPVKNADGSWSFKSRWNKWLSAHSRSGPERFTITVEPENKDCEQWWIGSYLPPAIPTRWEELLSNGGRRRFKAQNGMYLTIQQGFYSLLIAKSQLTVKPRNSEEVQEFVIEQFNENEVAIRTKGGYISHRTFDHADTRLNPNAWEMLTPVKNADGSWSFKSRYDKWLSVSSPDAYYQGYFVSFKPENHEGVHWWLESY